MTSLWNNRFTRYAMKAQRMPNPARSLISIVFLLCLLAQSPQVLAQGSDPFIGQLALVPYNFAPRGWAFCEGQILPISQNTALFSLLGTTYGGDGQVTFALPDLRGRVPISAGQGPGLADYILGQTGGEETTTLTIAQMPAHSHAALADPDVGSSDSPGGNTPARNAAGVPQYGSATSASLAAGAIGVTGGSQPHNNLQPYLTLHWIIALQGIFPTQNEPPQINTSPEKK